MRESGCTHERHTVTDDSVLGFAFCVMNFICEGRSVSWNISAMPFESPPKKFRFLLALHLLFYKLNEI
jgi:hypothetical protein